MKIKKNFIFTSIDLWYELKLLLIENLDYKQSVRYILDEKFRESIKNKNIKIINITDLALRPICNKNVKVIKNNIENISNVSVINFGESFQKKIITLNDIKKIKNIQVMIIEINEYDNKSKKNSFNNRKLFEQIGLLNTENNIKTIIIKRYLKGYYDKKKYYQEIISTSNVISYKLYWTENNIIEKKFYYHNCYNNPAHKMYFPFTFRCEDCRDILSSKNNGNRDICSVCLHSNDYDDYDDYDEDYSEDRYLC